MDITRALSRCTEIGDCTVWTGSVNSKGLPICCHNGKMGLSLMRVIFAEHNDIPIEDLAGLIVWPTCQTKGCIDPAHLRAATPTRYWAWRRTKGTTTFSAAHIAAITARVRARKGVTGSMEKARAVRAMHTDGATLRACAKEHGISEDMAYKIKRNICWREAVVGASVFSFRP